MITEAETTYPGMQSTLLRVVAIEDTQTSKVESRRVSSDVAGIVGEKGTSFVTLESEGT